MLLRCESLEPPMSQMGQSGHAAAPPSSATNSRRPMPDMGGPSLRDCRTLSLPPGRPVGPWGSACNVLSRMEVDCEPDRLCESHPHVGSHNPHE
jgi:hypothetical protein